MRRSVLVTGAGSGIGRATVELLAAKGYRTFATYRNPEDGRALGSLPNVYPVQLDLTDPSAYAKAVLEISAEVGAEGLYAIVNNAGINYAAPFEFADEERGRQVLEVNVMAPFRVSQRFLPLLLKYNEGNSTKARIVNISSWAGSLGQPFIPFYNASKFALTGMSESMFYDLSLLDVHVVLASPGVTKTPMLSKTTRSGTESLEGMSAEGVARYKPLLDNLAALGAKHGNSPLFQTPQQTARKLLGIIEARRPRYKYELSPDACIVNRFIAKFLPWRLKVAMNRSTFQLSGGAR